MNETIMFQYEMLTLLALFVSQALMFLLSTHHFYWWKLYGNMGI